MPIPESRKHDRHPAMHSTPTLSNICSRRTFDEKIVVDPVDVSESNSGNQALHATARSSIASTDDRPVKLPAHEFTVRQGLGLAIPRGCRAVDCAASGVEITSTASRSGTHLADRAGTPSL